MVNQELKGKIIGKYGTLYKFAKEMEITPTTLGKKIAGKSDWKIGEIDRACRLLEVDKSIFFNQ